MEVAHIGWRLYHAFASLAILGLACTADLLDHPLLRDSLLGCLLPFGFPHCHVVSSLNESSVLVRLADYDS